MVDYNETLKLASMSADDFSQGIARLISYVMKARESKKTNIIGTIFSGESTAPTVEDTIKSFTQE